MHGSAQMVGCALRAFVAGFLATVIFHQLTVLALNMTGLMPAGFKPWSIDPVPPFGVPAVISKAFWGGLWAILLLYVLRGQRGLAYWLSWTILGAVALSLVAIFVVPLLKGLPVPDFMQRFPIYALVNAAWGLGTALLLKISSWFSRG
jgi:hypothetical protein